MGKNFNKIVALRTESGDLNVLGSLHAARLFNNVDGGAMGKTSIVERFVAQGQILENEKGKLPDGVLCRVSYNICNIGEKNKNNRVYEKSVWDSVLANTEIQEKLKTRSLFSHAEHPETTQSNTEKVAAVVTEIRVDEKENKVFSNLDVLDTPYGRICDTLLRANCGLGVSTRAEGELEEVGEGEERYYKVIPESYSFVTIDFTADPSTYGSYPVKVERDLVKVVKQGIDNEKIDREYATVLLEHMRVKSARDLLESIKMDKHHTDCKRKPSEKKCTTCECIDKVEEAKPVNIPLLINKLSDEARTYYSKVKISPTGEEIYDYVAQELADELGIDYDAAYDKVESQLGKLGESITKEVTERVVKLPSGKWQCQSEKGRNMGTYDTKEEAEKRLKQVEYFKHKNERLERTMKSDPAIVIDGKTYKIDRAAFTLTNVGDPNDVLKYDNLPLDVQKRVLECAEGAKVEMTEEVAIDSYAKGNLPILRVDREDVATGKTILTGNVGDTVTVKYKGQTITGMILGFTGRDDDTAIIDFTIAEVKESDVEPYHFTCEDCGWEGLLQDQEILLCPKCQSANLVEKPMEEARESATDIVKQLKELKIQVAERTAERDKALEIVSRLSENYQKDVLALTEKVAFLNTLNENQGHTIVAKENKISELSGVIDAGKKSVQELTERNSKALEQLKEAHNENTKLLEKSIQALKESGDSATKATAATHSQEVEKLKQQYDIDKKILTEAHTSELNKLRIEHQKQLLKKYYETRLSTSGLKLPEQALTLLESCASEEEIDKMIAELRHTLRSGLLHSDKLVEIKMSAQARNPEVERITEQVGKAMSRMK